MRIATAALLAGALLLPAAESPFGVWWRGGENAAELKRQCPWLKGVFAATTWNAIEPEPGRFDWTKFDASLQRYAEAGLAIQLMVMAGPDSPSWLYEHGVPLVRTTPTLTPRGTPHWQTFPFYLDDDYRRFYHRMIRAVAEHIDTLPPAVRARILCFQTAEGTTGDEGGYKGTPLDSQYALPEDRWSAFKFETWRMIEALYRDKKPKIHILTNSGNAGQYHEWLLKNAPHWWRKAGNPGHGYQLNNERNMMAMFDPLINHPESGTLIRARSEMDETHKGWFREAPVWNMYWLNLWGLHFGLDILQHATNILQDRAHEEGFRFYSRYGGEKDPATSPGAWCALRDGLDAADFERFPADRFGSGALRTPAGIARTVKIAEAFAARGARQGDPEKGSLLIMQNRDAARMNDVGWNIETGNYQRYLRQIDPNGTSLGWWRVGPKDQPYGRFARGFDPAVGKNAMYFDLDDRFFSRTRGRVVLRVIYFDSGSGSWELRYDNNRVALQVRNGNSGSWKEASLRIADGRFANLGSRASDLALVNTSKETTLFHLIEVQRAAD